ncbi:hypothetical protein PRIPAC_94963 [Pristionchus pacificus]|uniref:Uncharacterized protein n=1 Tax=Pristionchus pacificus TaxID=54126 RepID=A0A2A6BAN6_PRIPA|nr:hypothetical protein PRIPAC_94963 [Pristionchus pacificus]|eukprot:PDM62901.1 hypothetical protein PRIPAC_50116 [Pristionchus pacificus]
MNNNGIFDFSNPGKKTNPATETTAIVSQMSTAMMDTPQRMACLPGLLILSKKEKEAVQRRHLDLLEQTQELEEQLEKGKRTRADEVQFVNDKNIDDDVHKDKVEMGRSRKMEKEAEEEKYVEEHCFAVPALLPSRIVKLKSLNILLRKREHAERACESSINNCLPATHCSCQFSP